MAAQVVEAKKAKFLEAARLLALGLADKSDDDEPTRAEWKEAFAWLWAAAPGDDARALLLELAAEVLEPAPSAAVQ
jgi:hypothetical protein